MNRLARPLAYLTGAIAALAGFRYARDLVGQPVMLRDVSGWADRTDATDALVEIVCLLGMALAGYVAVVAFFALLAEVAGLIHIRPLQRLLARALGMISIPSLRRRLVELGTAATITATVAHAVPVGAASPPVVLVADDLRPPSTWTQHPEGPVEPEGLVDDDDAVHVVTRGETLWGIIEQHYGSRDPGLLLLVLDTNPNIADPDLILVGSTIVLPHTVAATDALPEATWAVVTVAQSDTLWDIVNRHYGEATAELMWLTADANPHIEDINVIHPGQQVTLPPRPAPVVADAADVAPTAAPADTPHDPVASEPLPPLTASVPAPVIPMPADRAPNFEPARATAVEAARPTPPTTADRTQEATDEVTTPDADDDRPMPSIAVVAGWGGGAALAAALLGLAARRRRHSNPGRTRSRRAIQAGVALRETPRLSSVEFAARAMRDLASRIRHRRGEASPTVRLLRVGETDIEIVWETPNPDLLTPWTSPDGGWSWTLTTDATINDDGHRNPYPAFVTIGRTGGGDTLLNLESCGAFAVTGDPETVADVAGSIATELAASVFADNPTVLIVGDAITAAGYPDTAQHVTAADARAWLRDRQESATSLLSKHRLGTLAALRAQPKASDSHEPVIVVIDADSAVADVDDLVGLANGTLGAVVVVIGADGEFEGVDWSIHHQTGAAILRPLALRLDPVGLSPAFVETVDAELIPPPDPEIDEFDPEPAQLTLADEPAPIIRLPLFPVETSNSDEDEEPLEDEGAWDVELKVLGQVRAIGAKKPLTPTELHLAIYLAFHRHGENADTISCMIWPEGTTERNVVNTMGSLRRKLGAGSDGEMLFPLGRENQHTYTLSPRVTTDWERFVALTKRAETAEPDLAERLYDRAFPLIDGPPFRATKGYSWAYEDGTTSEITQFIERAAASAGRTVNRLMG